MDFFYDNYVWFIVIGVILFMALIGFIAEKTDFGRKQFEKKVKKEPKSKKTKIKKEPKKPVEEIIVENSVEESKIDTPVVIDDKDWMQPLENEEIIPENNIENEEETFESFGDEIINEDLTVPLVETEPLTIEDPNEISDETNFTVDEDLTVPFGDSVVTPVIDEVVTDEIVESINQEEHKDIVPADENIIDSTDLTPPNIDEFNKDEDDVWTF